MSLRRTITTGIAQLSSSTAWVAVVGFCQTVVLSRLLEPRDFGLTAMIWVVLGFAQMFCDAGVSNAIVQRREITPTELSSLYWLTAVTSVAIALLSVAAIPGLVAYYREPDLATLVPWIALTFVVGALGQPFAALAQRDLRFDRLALVDVLAATIAFTVSVAAAALGAGAHSLVFGGLASSLTRTASFLGWSWHRWLPTLRLRSSDLRAVRRFALFQIGDRIANYVWTNVDYLLVGRVLGSGPLGIYRLAYETVVRPLGTVNPILNLVAFPVFARRQDHVERLRDGFVDMTRVVAMVVFPMMAGLCVLGPLAVETVFGPQWRPAAPIIRILAPLGALRCLLNPGTTLLVAMGRIDRVFYLNLTLSILAPVVYGLALPFGLQALAWTALVLLAAVMIATWRPLYGSTIHLSPSIYLSALRTPALLSAAMAGVIMFLDQASAGTDVTGFLRLIVLVMVGTLTYAGLAFVLDRPYLSRLLSYRVSRPT